MQANISHLLSFVFHNFPSSGSGDTSFSFHPRKQRQASNLWGVQPVSKIHYNKLCQQKKKKPSHTSANTSVVRRLDRFSVNKRQKRLHTQSTGSFVSTVGTHTFQRLDEMLENTKHGDIALASRFSNKVQEDSKPIQNMKLLWRWLLVLTVTNVSSVLSMVRSLTLEGYLWAVVKVSVAEHRSWFKRSCLETCAAALAAL